MTGMILIYPLSGTALRMMDGWMHLKTQENLWLATKPTSKKPKAQYHDVPSSSSIDASSPFSSCEDF
jgi:hypothetical protein